MSSPVKPRTNAVNGSAGGHAGVRTRWLAFLVIAVTVGAYGNDWWGPFIGDDYPAIVNNPQIRSLANCWDALWDSGQTSVSGRPLVACSFALNYAVGGLSVAGYRAANVAIHALAAITLYGVVRRTLRSPAIGGRVAPRDDAFAAAVALVWAVHPLHAECVNYVVQRTELLVGLFFLLTLYCSVRGDRSRRSPFWSAMAVVCCTMGVLSKEVAAAAPLVVLLHDAVFLTGSARTALKRRPLLYAGLGFTWMILAGALVAGPRSASVGFGHGIAWWQYLLTQAGVISHYLRLAFWPEPLVVSYHDWPIAHGWCDALPSGLLTVAVLAGSIAAFWRRAWLAFLGAWFFLILAPTSSVVPIVTEVAAERRMYLPLAAVVTLMAVVAAQTLPEGASPGRRPARAARCRCLVVATAGVVVLLACLTWRRNLDYRTELSIWTDGVDKRPGNEVAHCGLGVALENLGRLDEAVVEQRTAIRLNPNYADGHFHLGHTLQRMDRHAEAAVAYRDTLRLDPTYHDALYNLGLASQLLGQLDEAIDAYRQLLRLRPNYPRAALNIGVALAAAGRTAAAIEQLRETLRREPDSADARFNLALLLIGEGRTSDAAAEFDALLRYHPDDTAARLELAKALAQLGRHAEAVQQFRTVIRQEPNNAEAKARLRSLIEVQP